MHPELTTFPHIDSYPAMLFLGFVSAYLLARSRAAGSGIERRHVDNLTLLLIISGLAGARLFSWLFYQSPHASFADNFKLWGPGGLVFYGGLVLGGISLALYAVATRIRVRTLGDIFAPSLALGLAFGRIGCFLAGCCWGDLCVPSIHVVTLAPAALRQVYTIPALSGATMPLRVTFPRDSSAFEQQRKLSLISSTSTRSLPVHPAQLYEAALALLLCVALNRRARRRQFDGEIVCLFGMGYGLIRFVVEFFRADNSPIYSGLTLSQVISLLIGTAGAGLYLRWNAHQAAGKCAPQSVMGEAERGASADLPVESDSQTR